MGRAVRAAKSCAGMVMLEQVLRIAHTRHDARWEASPVLLVSTPYSALPPPCPSEGGNDVRVAVDAQVVRDIHCLGRDRSRLHGMPLVYICPVHSIVNIRRFALFYCM